MKHVLVLVCAFMLGCSVHRNVDSVVQKRREEGLQFDASTMRDMGGLSFRERLFQGGYTLKGNWRIYDNSAPQLPDGSFPVLAEGFTEEKTTIEEMEKDETKTTIRDSLNVYVTTSGVDSEIRKGSERTNGEISFNWLRAFAWGICLGIVLIGLVWWKYGKKN